MARGVLLLRKMLPHKRRPCTKCACKVLHIGCGTSSVTDSKHVGQIVHALIVPMRVTVQSHRRHPARVSTPSKSLTLRPFRAQATTCVRRSPREQPGSGTREASANAVTLQEIFCMGGSPCATGALSRLCCGCKSFMDG